MRLVAVCLAVLAGCALVPRHAGPTPACEFESHHAEALSKFAAASGAAYRASLALETDKLAHLLNAEQRLSPNARAPIGKFGEEGLAAARRAVSARPDDASAQLLVALNLGMVGLGEGKVVAFMSGIPSRVIAAYRRALELDERVDSAGPLQLKGRFRSIVPWPYRDLVLARDALDRAIEIAPVKQSYFFLGDLHARLGNIDDARSAWKAALDAPAHPPAQSVAALVDKLIARRLALTAGSLPE